MRRRLAKQVSPARHGHDDFLPSAAPRCSSSDTFDVLVDAPSGQLRGGGSSKISPMSPGGDCVQNQFSSRAVVSALPFARLSLQILAFAGHTQRGAPSSRARRAGDAIANAVFSSRGRLSPNSN